MVDDVVAATSPIGVRTTTAARQTTPSYEAYSTIDPCTTDFFDIAGKRIYAGVASIDNIRHNGNSTIQSDGLCFVIVKRHERIMAKKLLFKTH